METAVVFVPEGVPDWEAVKRALGPGWTVAVRRDGLALQTREGQGLVVVDHLPPGPAFREELRAWPPEEQTVIYRVVGPNPGMLLVSYRARTDAEAVIRHLVAPHLDRSVVDTNFGCVVSGREFVTSCGQPGSWAPVAVDDRGDGLD